MSDVCLLLEGTYPYVSGGVSACVHQLLLGTPQINYTIVYIGAKRPKIPTPKYPVPNNVRAIKEVYLFEEHPVRDINPKRLGLTLKETAVLKQSLIFGNEGGLTEFYHHFFHPRHRRFLPEEVFYSLELWEALKEVHDETFDKSNAPSFIDFFYTWRFSVYPIFVLFQMDIPSAQLYHSMCTGYAGLLGSLAKERTKKRLIITEHGIYTHERKIEISQSEWLQTDDDTFAISDTMPFFKRWWYELFAAFGRTSYHYADAITTLYAGNQRKQLELGAPREKLSIISNGIRPVSSAEKITSPKITIAMVGRVVMIKDVKTFIKSIAFLMSKTSQIEVLVVGPTDEEPHYFQECQTLVDVLGLSTTIQFLGKRDMSELYPRIDIMALTSISEGQPLVLLEAFSHKIPVLATDVGSCRELVEGRDAEDRALGPAGFIAPFGRAEVIGQHLLTLVQDHELRRRMGESAHERLMRYYQERDYIKHYLNLYRRYI